MGYGKRLCDHRWYWAGIAGVGAPTLGDYETERKKTLPRKDEMGKVLGY